jgi:hypothetical protein
LLDGTQNDVRDVRIDEESFDLVALHAQRLEQREGLAPTNARMAPLHMRGMKHCKAVRIRSYKSKSRNNRLMST